MILQKFINTKKSKKSLNVQTFFSVNPALLERQKNILGPQADYKNFFLDVKASRQKSFPCRINSLQSAEPLSTFYNFTFDKGRLKSLVSWSLKTYGEYKTIQLLENLKKTGFEYATKAGISLGVEDLKIPPKKAILLAEGEAIAKKAMDQYNRSEITGVEKFQRLIDTWHRTSEQLKQEVIDYFESTDVLNPVYMMAFSGARGNISQVRQLVGMRGLMADPKGQIIDYPIRSNFREGLTVTEYIISSYGARKGIVDTALRTANAGYLTRRLVDVAQHVVISNFDCGTNKGIFLTDMKEGNKTIYSLQTRLIGRVLARDLYYSSPGSGSIAISNSAILTGGSGKTISDGQKSLLASRNQEITGDLAFEITKFYKKVFVRSALTCSGNSPTAGAINTKLICQLCYGWSLAQGNLVSIGEAVGIVAAQSIGEPGTQLTMRTFHTGGVFSGDTSDQIRSPFNGFVSYTTKIAGTLIRTPEGKMAFLTKTDGFISVTRKTETLTKLDSQSSKQNSGRPETMEPQETKKWKIPAYTILYYQHNQEVYEKQVIAQISAIARQQNMRDDSELTVKSEIQGEFLIKNLQIEKQFIGPKPKKKEKLGVRKNKAFSTGGLNFPSSVGSQGLIMEPKLTSWNWGYAWVLSCKQYKIPIFKTENKNKISFVPRFGDFVNKLSIMNQIQWYAPDNGVGAAGTVYFQKDLAGRRPELKAQALEGGQKTNKNIDGFLPQSLYYPSSIKQDRIKKFIDIPFKKESNIVSKNNYSPNLFNLYNYSSSYEKLSGISTNLKKDQKIFNNINMAKNLIFFDIQKLFFKKIGYFLDLHDPQTEDATSIQNSNSITETKKTINMLQSKAKGQKNFIFLPNNLKGLTNQQNYKTKSNYYCWGSDTAGVQLLTVTPSGQFTQSKIGSAALPQQKEFAFAARRETNQKTKTTLMGVSQATEQQVSTKKRPNKKNGGLFIGSAASKNAAISSSKFASGTKHSLVLTSKYSVAGTASKNYKKGTLCTPYKKPIAGGYRFFMAVIGFWTLKNGYKLSSLKNPNSIAFGIKNKDKGPEPLLFGLESKLNSNKTRREKNIGRKSNLEKISKSYLPPRETKNFVYQLPLRTTLKYSKFYEKGYKKHQLEPNNNTSKKMSRQKIAYFLSANLPQHKQNKMDKTNTLANSNLGLISWSPAVGYKKHPLFMELENLRSTIIKSSIFSNKSHSSALNTNTKLTIEFCNSKKSTPEEIKKPEQKVLGKNSNMSIPQQFYILNKVISSKKKTKALEETFFTKTNKVLRLFCLPNSGEIRTNILSEADQAIKKPQLRAGSGYSKKIQKVIPALVKPLVLLTFNLDRLSLTNKVLSNFNKTIDLGSRSSMRISTNGPKKTAAALPRDNKVAPTVLKTNKHKIFDRTEQNTYKKSFSPGFGIAGWVYKTFNRKAAAQLLTLDKKPVSYEPVADSKNFLTWTENVESVEPKIYSSEADFNLVPGRGPDFDNIKNINLISFCLLPETLKVIFHSAINNIHSLTTLDNPVSQIGNGTSKVELFWPYKQANLSSDAKTPVPGQSEKQKNIKWYVNPKPRFLPLEIKPQPDNVNFEPEKKQDTQKGLRDSTVEFYLIFKPSLIINPDSAVTTTAKVMGPMDLSKSNNLTGLPKTKNIHRGSPINNFTARGVHFSSKNLMAGGCKSKFINFERLALANIQNIEKKIPLRAQKSRAFLVEKCFVKNLTWLYKNSKKPINYISSTYDQKIGTVSRRSEIKNVIKTNFVNFEHFGLCKKFKKNFVKNSSKLESALAEDKIVLLAQKTLNSRTINKNIFITRNSVSSGNLWPCPRSGNRFPDRMQLNFNLPAVRKSFYRNLYTIKDFQNKQKTSLNPISKIPNPRIIIIPSKEITSANPNLTNQLLRNRNGATFTAPQAVALPQKKEKLPTNLLNLNFHSSEAGVTLTNFKIEKNILTLTIPCLVTKAADSYTYKYKFKHLNINLTYMLNSNVLFQSANKNTIMLNVLSSLLFHNNIWKYSNGQFGPEARLYSQFLAMAKGNISSPRQFLLSVFRQVCFEMNMTMKLKNYKFGYIFTSPKTFYKQRGILSEVGGQNQKSFLSNKQNVITNSSFQSISNLDNFAAAYGLNSRSEQIFNKNDSWFNFKTKSGYQKSPLFIEPSNLNKFNASIKYGKDGGINDSLMIEAHQKNTLKFSRFDKFFGTETQFEKMSTNRFTTTFKICFDNLNTTLNSLASTSFLSSYTGEIISNTLKTANQSYSTGRNLETQNLKAKNLALNVDNIKTTSLNRYKPEVRKGLKEVSSGAGLIYKMPKTFNSPSKNQNPAEPDNFTSLKGGACLVLTQKDILSFKTTVQNSNVLVDPSTKFKSFNTLTAQKSGSAGVKNNKTNYTYTKNSYVKAGSMAKFLNTTLFNTEKNNSGQILSNLISQKQNTLASGNNNSDFGRTSSQKIGDFVLKGTIYQLTSGHKAEQHNYNGAGLIKSPGEKVFDELIGGREKVFNLAGQIIHINHNKVTIRKAQPFFISAKTTFHAFHGDFVQSKEPIITLIYQKLKTGDIIQGIPKVEQFFEARTTKRGRLFRDNLPNLLKGLFLKYYFYCLKLIKQGWTNSSNMSLIPENVLPLPENKNKNINYKPGGSIEDKKSTSPEGKLDYSYIASQWAVKQSFYKIQQIAVDGVLRVYRSQGVTISDKHLEIIVKQMTTKVRIIQSGQTAFFPGEIVDLDFVQTLNAVLMRKIHYEPIILGITKASLQVDSFLSAASFQQTSKILSQAALVNKKDYLKGVKENVLLGNLIPAGTGYLIS